MGTVCFKMQKMKDCIEQSQLYQAKHGTKKGIIMQRCVKCFLLFERRILNPKKTCILCHYEYLSSENKKKFIDSLYPRKIGSAEITMTEELLYKTAIQRAIFLENRKKNILAASNGLKVTAGKSCYRYNLC